MRVTVEVALPVGLHEALPVLADDEVLEESRRPRLREQVPRQHAGKDRERRLRPSGSRAMRAEIDPMSTAQSAIGTPAISAKGPFASRPIATPANIRTCSSRRRSAPVRQREPEPAHRHRQAERERHVGHHRAGASEEERRARGQRDGKSRLAPRAAARPVPQTSQATRPPQIQCGSRARTRRRRTA